MFALMNASSLPLSYLSDDGCAVLFTVTVGAREVKCSISRAALEQYFWLRKDADVGQVLRTFAVGYRRISARAHRIALKSGAIEVKLDAADFAR
jgi:hypothetical protein